MRLLIPLLLLVSVGCATGGVGGDYTSSFPTFLQAGMTLVSEGICNIRNPKGKVPCKFYRLKGDPSAYVALYDAESKVVFVVRRIDSDGSQTIIWMSEEFRRSGPNSIVTTTIKQEA